MVKKYLIATTALLLSAQAGQASEGVDDVLEGKGSTGTGRAHSESSIQTDLDSERRRLENLIRQEEKQSASFIVQSIHQEVDNKGFYAQSIVNKLTKRQTHLSTLRSQLARVNQQDEAAASAGSAPSSSKQTMFFPSLEDLASLPSRRKEAIARLQAASEKEGLGFARDIALSFGNRDPFLIENICLSLSSADAEKIREYLDCHSNASGRISARLEFSKDDLPHLLVSKGEGELAFPVQVDVSLLSPFPESSSFSPGKKKAIIFLGIYLQVPERRELFTSCFMKAITGNGICQLAQKIFYLKPSVKERAAKFLRQDEQKKEALSQKPDNKFWVDFIAPQNEPHLVIQGCEEEFPISIRDAASPATHDASHSRRSDLQASAAAPSPSLRHVHFSDFKDALEKLSLPKNKEEKIAALRKGEIILFSEKGDRLTFKLLAPSEQQKLSTLLKNKKTIFTLVLTKGVVEVQATTFERGSKTFSSFIFSVEPDKETPASPAPKVKEKKKKTAASSVSCQAAAHEDKVEEQKTVTAAVTAAVAAAAIPSSVPLYMWSLPQKEDTSIKEASRSDAASRSSLSAAAAADPQVAGAVEPQTAPQASAADEGAAISCTPPLELEEEYSPPDSPLPVINEFPPFSKTSRFSREQQEEIIKLADFLQLQKNMKEFLNALIWQEGHTTFYLKSGGRVNLS